MKIGIIAAVVIALLLAGAWAWDKHGTQVPAAVVEKQGQQGQQAQPQSQPVDPYMNYNAPSKQ